MPTRQGGLCVSPTKDDQCRRSTVSTVKLKGNISLGEGQRGGQESDRAEALWVMVMNLEDISQSKWEVNEGF